MLRRQRGSCQTEAPWTPDPDVEYILSRYSFKAIRERLRLHDQFITFYEATSAAGERHREVSTCKKHRLKDTSVGRICAATRGLEPLEKGLRHQKLMALYDPDDKLQLVSRETQARNVT